MWVRPYYFSVVNSLWFLIAFRIKARVPYNSHQALHNLAACHWCLWAELLLVYPVFSTQLHWPPRNTGHDSTCSFLFLGCSSSNICMLAPHSSPPLFTSHLHSDDSLTILFNNSIFPSICFISVQHYQIVTCHNYIYLFHWLSHNESHTSEDHFSVLFTVPSLVTRTTAHARHTQRYVLNKWKEK